MSGWGVTCEGVESGNGGSMRWGEGVVIAGVVRLEITDTIHSTLNTCMYMYVYTDFIIMHMRALTSYR